MSYHVFIERALQPGNLADVAAAIAQRYGMPVDAISQRMAAGRFRVKANVDLPTAKAFAADLQKLGAIASVVDAATPVPGQPDGELASGLSAAFSGGHELQSLGALESEKYDLSAVDGSPNAPSSTQPTPAAAAGSSTPPVDEFAPPSDDSVVDIADIALALPMKTPLPMQARTAPGELTQAQRFSQKLAAHQGTADLKAGGTTGGTAKHSIAPRERFRELFVERPRLRHGVGVVLVIILAWIPAQIFWGSKVASAQAELDVTLQETVILARSHQAVWTDFEDIVRNQRELAGSRLFNQRITAVMIWLGFGALFGYIYYRKIPWDDI